MTFLVTNRSDTARGGKGSKRLGTHRRLDLWPPQWQKRPAVLHIKPRGSKEEQGGGVRRPGGRYQDWWAKVVLRGVHFTWTLQPISFWFFGFLDEWNPFRLFSFISAHIHQIQSVLDQKLTLALLYKSNLQTENHKLNAWHWIQQTKISVQHLYLQD